MRNSDYWRERAEILEQTRHASTADYVKILEAEYARFAARTNAKIKEWYDRLAANNEISFEKARQLLSDDELAEFHWSVEEYIKYGKQNAVDGRWMKQLENASAKVHISRLEAAKLHAQQQIEALTAEQISGIDELARDVYTETYSRTAFEIQRGIGVGWDISGINGAMLDKVVNKPWTTDNRTFRDRCWTNKIKLVDRVHKDIMQAIMTGQNPQLLAQGIADDFDVSRYQARRLAMTESAYFSSEAAKDCYGELDVERYEIVATLDASTSEICRSLDGKVFDMKVYEPGVTAPPFHPLCRTVTAPWYEDMVGVGERAARDPETGEAYNVPSDMTYEEWHDKFVLGKSVWRDIIGETTVAGVEITGLSAHFLERKGERDVNVEEAIDAIENPLGVVDRGIDAAGRLSAKYIGESATIVVNPDTGEVITTWRTGTDVKKRLRRRSETDSSK